MSRVLLTGASGFIGAHAVDALLACGQEVHAVARRAGARGAGVIWYEEDLLVPGAAERVIRESKATRLLHLAWYAAPGLFWTAPENERWIDASLRLLRAFGEGGGARAVMAGTCAEYRWGAEVLQERETPIEPATLYGACKHATHVAAAAVAQQLDVALAWGRIFFLYGPGEDSARLVPSVTRDLLAGAEVCTTDGLQRRDFMHVQDVAAAFASLLCSDVRGPVNIGTGTATAIRDVVSLIARQTSGLERVHFGALARRPGDPDVIAADVTRLTTEVGFQPTIRLEAGIVETVSWWRTHAGVDPHVRTDG